MVSRYEPQSFYCSNKENPQQDQQTSVVEKQDNNPYSQSIRISGESKKSFCAPDQIARRNDTSLHERNIKQKSEPELIPFNQRVSQEDAFQEVDKIFEKINLNGHRPDINNWYSLINACDKALATGDSKANVFEIAFTAYERMLREGIQPDQIIYQTLINICFKAGSFEKAWAVYDRMLADNIRPTQIIYQTLINVCAQVGDHEKAWIVYKAMSKEGIQPDQITTA